MLRSSSRTRAGVFRQSRRQPWLIYPLSNAEMVAEMIIGATPNETVTVANPTPPTNIPAAGFTPPSTAATAAPADPTTWGDPHLFSTASSGRPHEGAAYDGYDSVIEATYNNMMAYTTTPNISHPSHPDYAGATVAGMGEDAIGGGGGKDAVYADEELEDDEEDAAEAVREASGTKPRGRPPTKPPARRR